MSLIFFDGFQDALVMPKPEWSTAPSAVAAGRDGVATGAAQETGGTSRDCTLSSTAATCIVGTAFKRSGSTVPAIFYFKDTTPTVQLYVVLNATGFLEVRRTSTSGTLLGTSTGHTAIDGNWHYIEAKVTLHTSTGTAEVRLDGVTVLTLTGQVTSSTISNVSIVGRAGVASATCNWDDWYVCDAVDATSTQGNANNDYLGDIRVQSLFPSADGDTTQWTPSTGTDHFATVDENPANTTDYNSDSTSGHRDLYQVADPSIAVDKVIAIRQVLYVGKSDVGTVQVKPAIKENSTVTTEAAQAVALATSQITGAIRTKKPSNSTAWTLTDIQNLQIGAEVA